MNDFIKYYMEQVKIENLQMIISPATNGELQIHIFAKNRCKKHLEGGDMEIVYVKDSDNETCALKALERLKKWIKERKND